MELSPKQKKRIELTRKHQDKGTIIALCCFFGVIFLFGLSGYGSLLPGIFIGFFLCVASQMWHEKDERKFQAKLKEIDEENEK